MKTPTHSVLLVNSHFTEEEEEANRSFRWRKISASANEVDLWIRIRSSRPIDRNLLLIIDQDYSPGSRSEMRWWKRANNTKGVRCIDDCRSHFEPPSLFHCSAGKRSFPADWSIGLVNIRSKMLSPSLSFAFHSHSIEFSCKEKKSVIDHPKELWPNNETMATH